MSGRISSCLGILPVCKDIIANRTNELCNINYLQNSEIILTGTATWASIFVNWIATILLSELLQIPTYSTISTGKLLDFYKFSLEKEDELDHILYDINTLDTAEKAEYKCSRINDGFISCAHVMLYVLENRMSHYFPSDKYDDLGVLLVVSEGGWYSLERVLKKYPILGTFRGFVRNEATRDIFSYPFSFGEYCYFFTDDWNWILESENPLNVNSEIDSHFCHIFFVYLVFEIHGLVYSSTLSSEAQVEYLTQREALIRNCFQAVVIREGVQMLCKSYTVTEYEVKQHFPFLESELARFDFDDKLFLYSGYFATASELFNLAVNSTGFLLSFSNEDGSKLCSIFDSLGLNKTKTFNDCWFSTPGSGNFSLFQDNMWGEIGNLVLNNKDFEIIEENKLHLLKATNFFDISQILETLFRKCALLYQCEEYILFRTNRPSSLFLRHLYNTTSVPQQESLERRKKYFSTGSSLKLAQVHLPDYDIACDSRYTLLSNQNESSVLNRPSHCYQKMNTVRKKAVKHFDTYSPKAYQVINQLSLTNFDLEKILADVKYNETYRRRYTNINERRRQIVCDFVKSTAFYDKWAGWVPRASDLECLNNCSNNGLCVPVEDFKRYEEENDIITSNWYPRIGICSCKKGYFGNDCSSLVSPLILNISSADLVFRIYFSVFLLYATILILLLVWLHRVETGSIKSLSFSVTNIFFLKMVICHLLFGFVASLSFLGPSSSNFTSNSLCFIRPIFVVCSYTGINTCLFLQVLFAFRGKALNNSDIKLYLGYLYALLMAMFVLWFVVDISVSPHVELSRLEADKSKAIYACVYGVNLTALTALFFMLNLIIHISSLYFGYKTSQIPSYFNENLLHFRVIIIYCIEGFCFYFLSEYFKSPKERNKFIFLNLSSLLLTMPLTLLFIPRLFMHLTVDESSIVAETKRCKAYYLKSAGKTMPVDIGSTLSYRNLEAYDEILEEYEKIRQKYNNHLQLCKFSKVIKDVTFQTDAGLLPKKPTSEFNLDNLFSDFLQFSTSVGFSEKTIDFLKRNGIASVMKLVAVNPLLIQDSNILIGQKIRCREVLFELKKLVSLHKTVIANKFNACSN